ncbi:MAG: hypothetical protein K5851_01645 [Lachnospiraceae bacterium]|nr:hypothetical protein [Lachnospiraceae bacterium]
MKKTTLIKILVVLIVLGGIGFFARKAVVKKAAEVATEKMFDNLANESTENLTDEQAAKLKDVYKNMDQKDKDQVNKIVSNHLDISTIQKATQYVSNGDTASLKEMADSELSNSEKATMKELYKKYLMNN